MLKRPGWVLCVSILFLLPLAAGLRGVERDGSVDAFVPGDHPAAIARDRARELFGLDDPIIVGLGVASGASVWEPETLAMLRSVHEQLRQLPGVIGEDVVSIASERIIAGDAGDLLVDPILPVGPLTPASAALARERLLAMPMFLDLLAASNEQLLTVIVPVADPNHATELYNSVRALAEALAPPHIRVHISGVAAMNARLAQIVDTDTRIFVPAAIGTVLVILLIALRRPLAVVGPLFVVVAATVCAIGLMGWFGARYYLITTALPIVIMAIAVADCLHLSVCYLRHRSLFPGHSARTAVSRALAATWAPITLTSVTTIAAFLGLSLGSTMQPISEFGLFASVGVFAAWLFSLTSLPAILILTNLQPIRRQRTGEDSNRVPGMDRWIMGISRYSLAHPIASLAGLAGTVALLLLFALDARFDYERKRYFQADDPVRIADLALNEAMGGLNFLEVVVSANEPGGIMTVPALNAIAELRQAISGLPGVAKVTGIDEYIALMHEVLTDAAPGTLPERNRAPAQYMFLYEAASAPEDFKRLLEYEHQHALIRAHLKSDRYLETHPVVEELRVLAAEWSDRHQLNATLGGRVAVNAGWMTLLAENHFRSLGFAAALVLLTALLAFRELWPALLAMVPVCIGVLTVYAAMGALAIDIAPATSMTAAIATGLGIDFGIHLITHIRRELRAGASLEEAMSGHYLLVARACLYSAVALGVALAVLCLSSAPPLRWFGVLVSAGAFGSLFGALVLLPSVLVLVQPRTARRANHAPDEDNVHPADVTDSVGDSLGAGR